MEAWKAFLPSITTDPVAIESSMESINIIARHAEEKLQRPRAAEIGESTTPSQPAFHGSASNSQDVEVSAFQAGSDHVQSNYSSSQFGASGESMDSNTFAIAESDAESAEEESGDEEEVGTI